MKDKLEKLAADFKDSNEQIGAILKVAEEENRGLSDDETTRCDALEKQCDELKTEIDRLDADAKRKQRQQARLDYLEQPRQRLTTPTIPGAGDVDPSELDVEDRRRIRRQLHLCGRLRSFSGPDAQEQAHRCGQWLSAHLFGNAKALQWCREHGVESLAMGGDSNVKGGILVPQEYEAAVIKLREQYGVARRICRIKPMATDSVIVPRWSSGLTAYAVGDNTEVTASDAAWDNIELTARKWGVLSKHSSELDEDAFISMADELTDEAAYAFASAEDGCLVLGDGTSTYHSITGLPNAIAAGSKSTAASGNTAFSTLDLTDFEDMVGMLPEYAEGNPVWLISKVGYAASMMRLIDAAGGNTSAQIEGGARREFLGFPVVISQKCNTTTAAQTSTDGLCYFGDFGMGVLFGDRRGLRVLISRERYLEYDQIGILSTERMDINVHGRGTASAAGPIIMLSTPAS
jgi:HK97 family phage major capsid protein